MGARRLWILVFLLLVGPTPAAADHVSPVHWKERTITLRTHFADPQWRAVLEEAVRQWSGIGVMQINVVHADQTPGCRHRPDPAIIHVCVQPLPEGYAGFTGWGADEGHFPWAWVEFDDRAFTRAQQEHLACHEIGHALGLLHSSDRESCLHPGGWKRHPSAHDVAALRALYAHAD